MSLDVNNNSNFIDFLTDLRVKIVYKKKITNKILQLERIKSCNFKFLGQTFIKKNSVEINNTIQYVINVRFTPINTFFCITDCTGLLIFFCSGGHFLKGNQKTVRKLVFKEFFQIISSQLLFLRNKPLSLHLKNVGFNSVWITEYLKEKFFIKLVKTFNVHPHNGCRKKKKKRKKNKKISKISKILKIEKIEKKKWLSGLRRQIVNLLSLAHRRFESYFLQRFIVRKKKIIQPFCCYNIKLIK
jgi:ribosomal protein S11